MILYRPVGMKELRLVFESGMKAFPPRLPEQPFFYPVCYLDYARQIAFQWNSKSEPFAGYVTQFIVEDGYIQQFDRHVVGSRINEELWIPEDQLSEFNQNIIGKIKIVDAAFGEKFSGLNGYEGVFKGKDAVEQFLRIAYSDHQNLEVVTDEIKNNKSAVFINYPFWLIHDFHVNGVNEPQRQNTLELIKHVWITLFPDIPIGLT